MFQRKKIAGNPFISESVSGVFPYRFSGESSPDWDDVDTIDEIGNYGHHAADYVRVTKELAAKFELKSGESESEKWVNCTNSQKLWLAKRHIINSKTLRLEVYSEEEDKANFLAHADFSIVARRARIYKATPVIGYELSISNRKDLFGDVALKIAGYVEANDPDLSNWFNSVGPHVNGGFKIKPYFTTAILDIFISMVDNGVLE